MLETNASELQGCMYTNEHLQFTQLTRNKRTLARMPVQLCTVYSIFILDNHCKLRIDYSCIQKYLQDSAAT